MNIYDFDSYSEYLRALTKQEDSSMTVREMAEAAAVQRPYISNVLAEKAHLNREQGYRLGTHLGFDEVELSYFLNLIEIERASSTKYREYLTSHRNAMKKDAEKLANKLKRKPIVMDSEKVAEYFSTWEFCALHLMVSIPEFQTLRKIAKGLHLPLRDTQMYLNKLVNWQLIEKEKETYRWKSGNVHLPAGSPATRQHQRNWRERAVESAKTVNEKAVHFTSVYSMSVADAEKVRKQILKVIKDYSDQASRSKEETLVCLNVDLFRVQVAANME